MSGPPAGGAVPVVLRPAGQRIVGVGGGPVALAKLRPLVEAGADLVVVAPVVVDELAALASRVERRAYGGPSDLEGAMLVVAATGVASVNAAVAGDAAEAGIWCVRTDARPRQGPAGTAELAATVRRGPITIGVSTGGGAPALSRWLRRDLEEHYGQEWAELAELLSDLRADERVRLALAPLDDDARRAAWRSLPVTDILQMLRAGSVHSAREVAFACLSSSSG